MYFNLQPVHQERKSIPYRIQPSNHHFWQQAWMHT